jgi:hypothetical protein
MKKRINDTRTIEPEQVASMGLLQTLALQNLQIQQQLNILTLGNNNMKLNTQPFVRYQPRYEGYSIKKEAPEIKAIKFSTPKIIQSRSDTQVLPRKRSEAVPTNKIKSLRTYSLAIMFMLFVSKKV